jgi:hypothetical protein
VRLEPARATEPRIVGTSPPEGTRRGVCVEDRPHTPDSETNEKMLRPAQTEKECGTDGGLWGRRGVWPLEDERQVTRPIRS